MNAWCRRALAGVVLMVLVSVPAVTKGEEKSAGTKAPVFTAVTTGGDRFNLEETIRAGSAVVLNFWGIRCAACIAEMPHLGEIAREFGSRGVAVVGVNVDGMDPLALARAMEAQGIRPPYIILADLELKIAEMYQLLGAPLTIVIDRQGVVRYRHENYNPGEEREIRKAIAEVLP